MKGQALSAMCLAAFFIWVEAAGFENIGAANAQGSLQSDSRILISQVGVRGSGAGTNPQRTGRRGRHKKHRRHHRGRHRNGSNGAQNSNGSNPSGPWNNLNGLHNDGNSSNWNELEGARHGNRKHRRHKRRRGNQQNMQIPGNLPGATNPQGGQFGR